jgi:hypothetical protein
MINPRLYRAALAPIVVAVILAAFSLQDLPLPLVTNAAPDAFQAAATTSTLNRLAARYPLRRPGSAADDAMAREIASDLRASDYRVRTLRTSTQTADGERTVSTVMGTRLGGPGAQIVVVADRAALGRGAVAQLSGTAVMLELARVLSSGTVHRTLTFVSTSGDGGGAAAAAAKLQRPVDAVLVLGDLASSRTHQPHVVAWSDSGGVAPLVLQRTLALSLGQQTGLINEMPSTATQLARFAFPFSLGDQGVFGAAGLASVQLTVSGERPPPPDAPISVKRMTAAGRAALRTMTALDQRPGIGAAPAPELVTARKSVPPWAIRILVAALILAPLVCAVDGFARLRRRGASVAGGLMWIARVAIPFFAALALIRVFGLVGLLSATPRIAVAPGAIPIDGTARIAMIAAALGFALAWFGVRELALGPKAGEAFSSAGGAGALLLVLCAIAFVVWLVNPYAALLLVPALHLWLPIYAPGVAMRRAAALALFVAGLLPFVLVALIDAASLRLGVDDLAWLWLLLVAAGHLAVVTWLLWSLLAACVVGTCVLALRSRAAEPGAETPITVRGPLTYAGPGSLGGTDSAL